MALMLLFISGCNKPGMNDSINQIKLECLQSFNEEKCENQDFNNDQSLKIFEEAITTATKMLGELNYGAEYNMTITYSNNTIKNFHLSLGSDRSMKGLLVDQTNTSQGYEISMKYANQLRDLLNK
ncbi:hypothetical protein [Paenibacillus sp. KN14-4R]|uniref:hypothetical protein n=1 Tax=Paenibacillus sp. KN14-4R TaxID=3445773 RepID=UPI003FA00715